MRHDDKLKVIQAMQDYGGSFVQQLAKLWLIADETNCQRIERAFDEYIEKYKNMAEAI